ncbi:MAG TPA: hypothetical protein VFK65_23815 [Candidatus Binatia bacterium]|nr:hypothetical protein [Candidatus Binatia bacterium]
MRQSFIKAPALALAFVLMSTALLTAGCSAAPTSDPHDTRPIPEGAKFEGKCTFLGEIGCSVTSWFSGDAGYERRWACIAFIEPNGTKVEQCGSVPGSSRGP